MGHLFALSILSSQRRVVSVMTTALLPGGGSLRYTVPKWLSFLIYCVLEAVFIRLHNTFFVLPFLLPQHGAAGRNTTFVITYSLQLGLVEDKTM